MRGGRTYRGINLVSTSRGRFVEKAVGEGKTGNFTITIHGKRSPALRPRYNVLIESLGKTVLQEAGGPGDVRYSIEESAKEGTELFDMVVAAISDNQNLSRLFQDEELLCLAVFMKGPKSFVQLAERTGMENESAAKAMRELIKDDIVCKGSKISTTTGQYQLYQLSEIGEQCVETIMAEDRFLEIQKQIGESADGRN